MRKKFNNLPEMADETTFEKLKDEYKENSIEEDLQIEKPETSEEKIKEQIKKDTVVLVRENWILKVWSTAIFANKETWIYTQRDATEKYILVDFDSTKVAPIAKWILNELSLFPELKWIKWVARWNYAIFFIVLMTMAAMIIFTPSVDQIVAEVKKAQAPTATWATAQQRTPQEIFRQIEERKLREINQSGSWVSAE